MPIVIAIASLYLLQACGGANYNSYVADYQEIAMNEMERTGYPASIKLAQAILESEGGRGKLAFEYNNHFGIICGKNWPGKKYYQEEEDFNSGEVIETCYRAYNNPFSSFIAHTDLLKESKHYKSLFKLDPSDYTRWAEKLTELGYTDNDTYGNTLISMIEKYELYQFDDLVTGKTRPIASKIDKEEAYQERDDERPYRNNRVQDRTEIEDLEEDIRTRTSERARRERSERWAEEAPYREDVPNKRDRNFDYDNYMQDVESYEAEDRYGNTDYEEPEQEGYFDEEADDYQERPYRRTETNERYSDYDDLQPTSRQRTSRTYEDNPTRYSRSSSSNDIDSKYEGLGDMYTSNPVDYRDRDRYETPSRSSRDRDRYEAPSRNSRNRDNYERPSRSSRDNRENVNYETSISDFETPEDYAYINGTKVTIARYDDTPLLIAARYNVSVKDITKYNEYIKSNKQLLREGTKVFLQAKKKNYEDGKSYHEVQFGERMEDIAQLYGLSLAALYEKNRMPANSEPALGERIKLNRGKAKRRPELRAHYRSNYANPDPIAPTNRSTPPNRVAIKERPSKTIKTQIVDNYPNNIANNNQSPVTTVLLQPVTTKVMYHTVKEGETLYNIARQHSTTAEVIRSMNNLKGNTISKGRLLKVR